MSWASTILRPQFGLVGQGGPHPHYLGPPGIDHRRRPLFGQVDVAQAAGKRHQRVGDVEEGVAVATPLVVEELHAVVVDDDVVGAQVRRTEGTEPTATEQCLRVLNLLENVRTHIDPETFHQHRGNTGHCASHLIRNFIGAMGNLGSTQQCGEVVLPADGRGVHASHCLSHGHQRVSDGVRVGVFESDADCGGVAEITQDQEASIEVGRQQFGAGACVLGKRVGELIRHRFTKECGLDVEVTFGRGRERNRCFGSSLEVVADLLDHQSSGQGERVLGDTNAQHDGAATPPEIYGIHQGYGCPCAACQQLLSSCDDFGNGVCQ